MILFVGIWRSKPMSPRSKKTANPARGNPVIPEKREANGQSNAAPGRRNGATEEEIRLLAYHKWTMAGRPKGDGVSFWLEAERELKQWI
jgi:Protein of unknown function (DUF2934)